MGEDDRHCAEEDRERRCELNEKRIAGYEKSFRIYAAEPDAVK